MSSRQVKLLLYIKRIYNRNLKRKLPFMKLPFWDLCDISIVLISPYKSKSLKGTHPFL